MDELINSNPAVLDALVTYDESWIYCYDPETKRKSSQRKHTGSPRPKKARQSKSTHKLLMIPFFDSTGMIYMHWVPTGQAVNKEYYVEVLREFRKRFPRKRPALFKSGQWHFHLDNAPVHSSILVTDHLTKMGIKTVPQPPYSSDLAPCDFCLFPKLKEKHRGCRYETIEEMKEAVTKVIDTLTQEDFYGALHKLLERCNKCIPAGGDYFEGVQSFMCVLSIKVPIRKKSGDLLKAPRTFTFGRIPFGKVWTPYPPKYIGGARGVMVIVVGNGHGDTSSNPGPDWLHFT